MSGNEVKVSVQLRAVKKAFGDSLPAGIAPCDLIVYRNRGDTPALQVSVRLAQLGLGEDHALAVAISAQTRHRSDCGESGEGRATMGQVHELDLCIKALANERVTLPMTREALQGHLERELREKIPIRDHFVNVIARSDLQQRCDATFYKLFAQQEHGLTPQTIALVWRNIKPMMPCSDSTTQASYHYFTFGTV